MRADVAGVAGLFAGILLFALLDAKAGTTDNEVTNAWAIYLGCELRHSELRAAAAGASGRMSDAGAIQGEAMVGFIEAVRDGRVRRSAPVDSLITASEVATEATLAWMPAETAANAALSDAIEARLVFVEALARGGVVVEPVECQG